MATKQEPVRVPTDINEVVKEELLLVRHESMDKTVSLKVTLARRLPKVPGDRVQLQQVMVNLLVNSIQAIAQNDAPIRDIFLGTACEEEGAVCVSIRDTGPGIAESDLDRVFDSFFSTKQAGIGIGLSICKSIITAHGGDISAANHSDGGALFRFSLPVDTC